ncbi:hypothetical protein [uncultured Selenomonas sp.]|uniref:hypothetical protein n=1 Tax=uncultured Selenomonas sp. TaxID=159275 RepID=UPI0025D961E9|nr:hypothetical protein [uncultured Selenomonas sp.]
MEKSSSRSRHSKNQTDIIHKQGDLKTLILLFMLFFAIGAVLDFLGLGGKKKKKQETELERMQREQMIREANERFRPHL